MAKTLQKLMMEELGTDNPDAADAAVEVVLDWLQRTERNGNVALYNAWRETVDGIRRSENKDGRGR